MCNLLYVRTTFCTQAMNLDTFDRLFGVAEAQAGYFTTAQAKSVGVDRAQLSRYVTAGKLERVRQGVYRLKPFPHVPHEDLFIAWLATGPDAVVSHDSALALHELSDVLPTAIHLTVPRTASRRRPGLRLHTNRITAAEMTHYGAMRITTAPRTIVDVAADGLADELVVQAVDQALSRALTSPEQLLAAAAPRGAAVLRLIRRAIEHWAPA